MSTCEYNGEKPRCKFCISSGRLVNSVRCQIRGTLKEVKKSFS